MKFKLKLRQGTTLVELVVCFAMIGIFLSAAAICVNPILHIYRRSQKLNQAQQLAGIVIEYIRGESETALGTLSVSGNTGYIKLRSYGEASQSDSAGNVTGSTLEFVLSGNDQMYLEQIDSLGVSAWGAERAYGIHQTSDVLKRSSVDFLLVDPLAIDSITQTETEYKSGQLNIRCFAPYPNDSSKFYDYDPEKRCSVLYDYSKVLDDSAYMGFAVGLSYQIPQEAFELLENGEKAVKYFAITVTVSENESVIYEVSEIIKLLNQPLYVSDDTTEWDVNCG